MFASALLFYIVCVNLIYGTSLTLILSYFHLTVDNADNFDTL